MLGAVGRGEHGGHGERGRDGGDPDMADQAALEGVDILAHGAGVADDAPRPFEHALSLGSEPAKARPALHQHHPERVLQRFDAGGQSRLAHPADLGGAAKVLLAGERDDEFKLVDHGGLRPEERI